VLFACAPLVKACWAPSGSDELNLNCRKQAWLLKNFLSVSNRQNLGDRKCLGKPRKSFVGHSAILFFANFVGRSFSTATVDYTQNPALKADE
jgi:hypothetical protein